MDVIGQKFGMLTVIELAERRKTSGGTVLLWRCRCDCGGESKSRLAQLRNGMTKSCGCLKRKAGDQTRTHGMSNTKVYELWTAMIQRARGHRAQSYVERNIGVCERWLRFENFLADMGEPPGPRYSLEREDNDKGYEPGNCVWLPMVEQWRNRSNTTLHDFMGERLSLREIAERSGINRATLWHRVAVQGLSIQAATAKR